MGYTSTPYSVFASNMRQTPKTLAMVLDFAGWKVAEAANATGIDRYTLQAAMDGLTALLHDDWLKLLDACGKRAWDIDGDSE
ncbi:MAG: hypothetical protein ABS69_10655 [Nitrosomonadales bacterium SCN 54-20]|nr:MAG: hypothetical protein ABS69_10655 [Nitrosomonadales bacterium SCN 54-20]